MYQSHLVSRAWSLAESLFPDSYPSIKYTATGMLMEVSVNDDELSLLRKRLISSDRNFIFWQLARRKASAV